MYKDWLQRKEWQEKKTKILFRDNHKCQSSTCKTPNSILDVHHIEYLSYDLKPWEYPDDMLISLCRVCHSRETNRFSSEDSLLTCLKMKGFLVSDLIALTTKLYIDNVFTQNILNELKEMKNG